MTPDFIVFRWRPMESAAQRYFEARAARLGDEYTRLLDWRGILVLARDDPSQHHLTLPNGRGVLFGFAWPRASEQTDVSALPDESALDWVESGGVSLLAKYWGPFAALLVDRGYDHLHVVACPSGVIPLHFARCAHGVTIFSEADTFAKSGGVLDIDVEEVARFLAYPNRFTRRAAIKGVERLWPGSVLTLSRDKSSEAMHWRPPTSARIDDSSAANQLREGLMASAREIARGQTRIVHRLSGGLDSSIVLGALRAAAPDTEIVCVNDFSDLAGEGDERAFARIAAAHAHASLIENEVKSADVDYARMLDMPLSPSPSSALASWSWARSSVRAGGDAGGPITSGQGGDHVFYRGRSVAPAVDAFRDGLGLTGLAREAARAARRMRRSVWSDARETTRLLRGGAFDLTAALQRKGQSRAIAKAATDDHLEHPWFQDIAHMHPGHAHRLLLWMDAQTYFGPSRLRAEHDFMPPLLFEPMLEAAFAIPSYVMNAGGRERGLARIAFADVVPRQIVEREAKGQTTRFVAASIARNADFLCDLLEGGELARLDLIDSQSIISRIRACARVDGAQPSGISPAICAEMWLRAVLR